MPVQDAQWLLVVYHVPARAHHLHAAVEQRMRDLGGQHLQRAAVLLADSPTTREALTELRREVMRHGGMMLILRSRILAGEPLLQADPVKTAADPGTKP